MRFIAGLIVNQDLVVGFLNYESTFARARHLLHVLLLIENRSLGVHAHWRESRMSWLRASMSRCPELMFAALNVPWENKENVRLLIDREQCERQYLRL